MCLRHITCKLLFKFRYFQIWSFENEMDRVKRIWYLSPMRAAKVQASLRIRAVLPEPPLLAHTSSESRETFRQKARSLAPLNGWACAVTVSHDGMLEDTNSLDAAQIVNMTAYLYRHTIKAEVCQLSKHLDKLIIIIKKKKKKKKKNCVHYFIQ